VYLIASDCRRLGIPVPAFASVGPGGGLSGPPKRPQGSIDASQGLIQARQAAMTAFVSKGVAKAPKELGEAAASRLNGVDLLAGRGIPDAVRNIKNGEKTLINGIEYSRGLDNGALAGTVPLQFQTGVNLSLKNGKDITEVACNAVTVVLNSAGTGLTTVFPKVFADLRSNHGQQCDFCRPRATLQNRIDNLSMLLNLALVAGKC
jgi:hypothetical protein